MGCTQSHIAVPTAWVPSETGPEWPCATLPHEEEAHTRILGLPRPLPLGYEKAHVAALHLQAIPHRHRFWMYQILTGGLYLRRLCPDLYRALLKRGPAPASQQQVILQDSHRTLPTIAFFGPRHRLGPGSSQLTRLLTAYAHLDEELGYCQGMNFLAALLLLSGLQEEAAFYAFAGLMLFHRLRWFFLPGLPMAMTVFSLLEQLLPTKLPAMAALLEECGIQPQMYAAQWLLSGFISSPLPPSSALLLLDRLLLEGPANWHAARPGAGPAPQQSKKRSKRHKHRNADLASSAAASIAEPDSWPPVPAAVEAVMKQVINARRAVVAPTADHGSESTSIAHGQPAVSVESTAVQCDACRTSNTSSVDATAAAVIHTPTIAADSPSSHTTTDVRHSEFQSQKHRKRRWGRKATVLPEVLPAGTSTDMHTDIPCRASVVSCSHIQPQQRSLLHPVLPPVPGIDCASGGSTIPVSVNDIPRIYVRACVALLLVHQDRILSTLGRGRATGISRTPFLLQALNRSPNARTGGGTPRQRGTGASRFFALGPRLTRGRGSEGSITAGRLNSMSGADAETIYSILKDEYESYPWQHIAFNKADEGTSTSLDEDDPGAVDAGKGYPGAQEGSEQSAVADHRSISVAGDSPNSSGPDRSAASLSLSGRGVPADESGEPSGRLQEPAPAAQASNTTGMLEASPTTRLAIPDATGLAEAPDSSSSPAAGRGTRRRSISDVATATISAVRSKLGAAVTSSSAGNSEDSSSVALPSALVTLSPSRAAELARTAVEEVPALSQSGEDTGIPQYDARPEVALRLFGAASLSARTLPLTVLEDHHDVTGRSKPSTAAARERDRDSSAHAGAGQQLTTQAYHAPGSHPHTWHNARDLLSQLPATAPVLPEPCHCADSPAAMSQLDSQARLRAVQMLAHGILPPREKGFWEASAGFMLQPGTQPTDAMGQQSGSPKERYSSFICDNKSCSEWALPVQFAAALKHVLISNVDIRRAVRSTKRSQQQTR